LSSLEYINTRLNNIPVQKLDKKHLTSFSKYQLKDSHHDGKNMWILKPAGLNRGRGIHIVSNIDKMKSIIKELSEGMIANYDAP
jgi:phosphoribosylamine-glycine ligase